MENDLLATIKAKKYFLLTNDEGAEIYDEKGNLLVYDRASNECASVPNVKEVRELYDIPLTTPENKDVIPMEETRNVIYVPPEKSLTVWMGRKTEHSVNATKMLIKLFDSPKYQTAMNKPNVVKQKVWDEIASELQQKGFKIADNTKDAGLRAFQKWRNMVRSYWRFMKLHPGENVDYDQIDGKPYFFKDLHPVMVKRTKKSPSEDNSLFTVDANEGIQEVVVGDEVEDIVDLTQPEVESAQQKKQPDSRDTDKEPFPRRALTLMTALVTSQKYDAILKDPTNKSFPKKIKIWENIYTDMMKEGWKFGGNIREGALILSEKWRMVEKSILMKKVYGPRTLYTPSLRNAVLMEIEERKTRPPNYTRDFQSTERLNCGNRRLKNGEIEPNAVVALLKLLLSGHYQKLLIASRGERTSVWEKILEDLQSQGYEIAGTTKLAKVTRLFQKWRNMKRSSIKYLNAKFKGGEVRKPKKPPFYELVFDIISKEVLNRDDISDCDSDEDRRLEEVDESKDENQSQQLIPPPMDHDYYVGDPEAEEPPPTPQPINTPRNHGRSYRSYKALLKIKSITKQSIIKREQNFAKLISLMENQVRAQNRLTAIISDYITTQTIKDKSRYVHNRTEPVRVAVRGVARVPPQAVSQPTGLFNYRVSGVSRTGAGGALAGPSGPREPRNFPPQQQT